MEDSMGTLTVAKSATLNENLTTHPTFVGNRAALLAQLDHNKLTTD